MTTENKTNKKKKILKITGIIFVALFIVALSGFNFYLYKKTINTNSDNKELSANEISKIVEKVKKIAVVPEDETPSVAIVTDPTLLDAKSFFSSAKKGDIVLLYSSIKRVILYDQKLNKVIDMAPINVNALQQNSTQASP